MKKIENFPHTYKTLDLYVSAFLLLCGIKPDFEISNGKVVFTFPVTDDFYKFISYYNMNSDVKVADFVTAIKTLRGQMLTLRGQR